MVPYQAYVNVRRNHPSDVVFVKADDLYTTYGDDAIVAGQVLGMGVGIIMDPDDGGRLIPYIRFPIRDVEECAKKFIIAGRKVIMVEPQ